MEEPQFRWPGGWAASTPDLAAEPSRPLARPRRGRATAEEAFEPTGNDDANLRADLELAHAAIAKLEADRRSARARIEELETARDALQARLTAQRRRLLLLERQLEDAEVLPAPDVTAASWLERLFGGHPPVPTA